MIAWRVLPWDPAVAPTEAGGALWFPRPFQGAGRHDAPEHYGCLYASESPAGAVAETLAVFRGAGALTSAMLTRSGRPLGLAGIDAGTPELLDLDDPSVLLAESLRPSRVATQDRARTQGDARRLHERHPSADGLRWWSTLEASWINVTLFDRAAGALSVRERRELALDDPAVVEAAQRLGLA